MASFDDSITKMLWPEKREKDAVLGDKVPGVIDRTTMTSWLRVPTGYLPDVIKDAQDVLQLIVPSLRSGRDRDRPDPGRHAGRSAGEFRPAAADRRASASDWRTTRRWSRSWCSWSTT